MNTTELDTKKTDLINEKAGIIQRLAEVNALIRSGQSTQQLQEERAGLVRDCADIDAELREVSQALRKAQDTKNGMHLIVLLVCARITAGSTDGIEALTRQAVDDLKLITATA